MRLLVVEQGAAPAVLPALLVAGPHPLHVAELAVDDPADHVGADVEAEALPDAAADLAGVGARAQSSRKLHLFLFNHKY